jgi:flavodoxin
MKTLIVYSSKTGNTRALAEAIHIALPNAELCRVELAPDPAKYDLVFLGFWIENASADGKMQHYMSRLNKQQVALFATLGAYPDSKHAAESLAAAAALLPNSEVKGHFICQGAIDPELVEWMKTLPKEHGFGPTASRKKLWQDAASHPDEDDLQRAAEWALGILEAQNA